MNLYLRLSLFDSLFQILCANPGCRHQFMSRRAPSFGDGMYQTTGLQNVGQNVGSDDSKDETNSNLSGNDNDQHEDDNIQAIKMQTTRRYSSQPQWECYNS